MKIFSLITLLLAFLVPPSTLAGDFSGSWFMSANGYEFELSINQSGNNISGEMITISDNSVSQISGIISENKIEFSRTNLLLNQPQQYTGFLFRGPRVQTEMAGTFWHSNSSDYGWYATRQQNSMSLPTDCDATYQSGNLHIPCVSVPDAFGGITVYDIELNQQAGSFTFDLDMGSVKPK
jgi:hypothetical protein